MTPEEKEQYLETIAQAHNVPVGSLRPILPEKEASIDAELARAETEYDRWFVLGGWRFLDAGGDCDERGRRAIWNAAIRAAQNEMGDPDDAAALTKLLVDDDEEETTND